MKTKKTWQTPQIITYGTVEELTRQDKQWGESDSFTLMGQPIMNAS